MPYCDRPSAFNARGRSDPFEEDVWRHDKFEELLTTETSSPPSSQRKAKSPPQKGPKTSPTPSASNSSPRTAPVSEKPTRSSQSTGLGPKTRSPPPKSSENLNAPSPVVSPSSRPSAVRSGPPANPPTRPAEKQSPQPQLSSATSAGTANNINDKSPVPKEREIAYSTAASTSNSLTQPSPSSNGTRANVALPDYTSSNAAPPASNLGADARDYNALNKAFVRSKPPVGSEDARKSYAADGQQISQRLPQQHPAPLHGDARKLQPAGRTASSQLSSADTTYSKQASSIKPDELAYTSPARSVTTSSAGAAYVEVR